MSAPNKPPEQNKPLPVFNLLPKVINGGIAGVVGVTCVFPIDMCKTRLQNQHIGPNGERQYRNMPDCIRQTLRSDGFFGMYRGSAVNILLITPEKAIKLSSNDMFRHYLTKPNGELPVTRQMLAGGMAGACQVIITTPMELLKIQMQDSGRQADLAKKAGIPFERVSALQVAKRLVRERGVLGLYRGFRACATRDISFSIIFFPTYSLVSDLGPKLEDGATPFWWSFISGLTAGSIAAFLDTPVDVMKTRLQTIDKVGAAPKYKGLVDCVKTTYKEEGFFAFFKGGGCRVMVIAPLFGIAQTVYYFGIGEDILGYKK
ncbi:hypothetical protein JYU34_005252 [Plutella xylostella]|uniref:Uncharacterized protein n=1 Tax=Plutella xylostella TaxID=51655 RepID=A0ABQ7QW83_PLUXY|nr:mitochondrial glutamate carrier 1 [Plutella xylostella]KAG7309310.1 hypothetical protein JYU34_005252 [Plutella xylostella]